MYCMRALDHWQPRFSLIDVDAQLQIQTLYNPWMVSVLPLSSNYSIKGICQPLPTQICCTGSTQLDNETAHSVSPLPLHISWVLVSSNSNIILNCPIDRAMAV